MDIGLVFNILIVFLLVTGILYVIVLDSHLSKMKEENRIVSRLIDEFSQISKQVSNDLIVLRGEQKKIAEDLSIQINQAMKLKSELAEFLLKIDAFYLNNSKVKPDPVQTENLNHSTVFNQNENAMMISSSEKELLTALNEIK